MFVGGLKWETTNESLFNHFCKFGAIEESVVMVDTASGLSRGFGFVTFAHPSILDRVLKQDHTIDGKLVSFLSTLSFASYIISLDFLRSCL